jgi:aspartate racemase
MKKPGIIGGIGPESTLDYYRGIIDAFKDGYAERGYPEMLIDSINLKTVLMLADRDDWFAMAELFAFHFELLRKSGADFGVIASNTPHRVFGEIQAQTRLPLISIVEATCAHIGKLGISNVILLGTGYTMRSGFYADALARHGITAVVPAPEEIDYIQEKLMTEIELGIIKPETKKGILDIIGRIERESGTEGVILGCTELPLIIGKDDIRTHYIDTMRIHIGRIVDEIKK